MVVNFKPKNQLEKEDQNMRKANFILIAFVFLLAIVLPAQAGETIKIASSLAITGPTSDVGNPYSKGIEDYVKFVNDMKMLGDDKLEAFVRDDGYQNEVTKRNFEEFLDEGIVLYLNYSTGSTLALGKDFDEEKIPVIPASFHAGNLAAKYVFLPIVSYSSQAIAMAEYIANNHKGGGKPMVAMFIHPSAFGRAPVEDLKKAVAAGLNIEIVEVVEHGKAATLHGKRRAVRPVPHRPAAGGHHAEKRPKPRGDGQNLRRKRQADLFRTSLFRRTGFDRAGGIGRRRL
jgi:ABC-type branched-subunit amino acid transport system substrate-binding protein